jgi:hypothetical protein
MCTIADMENVKICLCIIATRSYTYAMISQARRVVSAILNVPRGKIAGGQVVLVGDTSKELEDVEKFYNDILPNNWHVIRITGNYPDNLPNYKIRVQKLISTMRSVGFSYARKHDFDLCWSLDSDVLPPHNVLSCMITMLEFDNGYYKVACSPYPSQGGGDFLAGRGSDTNPILPDVYEDERLFTDELEEKRQIFIKELKDGVWKDGPELNAKRKWFSEEVQKMPAKGDVFFLNSHTGVKPFVDRLEKLLIDHPEAVKIIKKESEGNWKALGFRRRGWLSAAYPGIGLGSILPIDWFGMGALLMQKESLHLTEWSGYNGEGTEDIFIQRVKWKRNGIRMCALPHCPSDHVIRGKSPGEFILCQVYHETANAECVGHLRVERRPWFQQIESETATEEPTALY